MRNKVKEAIQQVKQELSNAQYFAEQIEVRPKDNKTKSTKAAIIATLRKINEVIRKDLSDLEKEVDKKESDANFGLFKKSLGTINAPTASMRETADRFLEGSKTPNALIKKAVQEQIRKASSSDVKKASAVRPTNTTGS